MPTSPATIQVFRNCAELNAVYPGGVARVDATGNTVSGTLRPFGITPHFDDALYQANVVRDCDKDGIASTPAAVRDRLGRHPFHDQAGGERASTPAAPRP